MTKLGTFRAVYLVALSCVGSFLFAYDTGIVGGVLTLESFQTDFHVNPDDEADIASLSASLLQAGAFFSCFFAWPFTARFGRRLSIVLASAVFVIGAIMQLFGGQGIALWYAGRTISGVGVGIATVIIPMFSAEMAPKEIRGRLGSMFQFFFTLGVMVSYWVDYGVSNMAPTTTQWRIPVGLQLVPGCILGLGMLFVKDSVRWYAKKGRYEDAMDSLTWIRGGEDPLVVQAEMNEILAGIEEEERITEGLTWKEYLLPANRYRLFIAITLQIGVQLTGNTSLAYFSPQIFAAIGAGDSSLFLSGFLGVCKVVSCLFFLLFLVERIGRKWSLFFGSMLMGCFMIIVAILTLTTPPSAGFTSSAIASVAMIYLETMTYNCSWGPVSWLYMSEIFPTRIREGGIAVGTATQWLFNFTFSQITPHAVNNLGWKVFLMFAIFNWALVVYTWFFIKETKGKSLEEMEYLFDKNTQLDVEGARRKAEETVATEQQEHADEKK